jgi:hypothetical protein
VQHDSSSSLVLATHVLLAYPRQGLSCLQPLMPSLLQHMRRDAPSLALEFVPSFAFIQLRWQPSLHLFCNGCSLQCPLARPWPR